MKQKLLGTVALVAGLAMVHSIPTLAQNAGSKGDSQGTQVPQAQSAPSQERGSGRQSNEASPNKERDNKAAQSRDGDQKAQRGNGAGSREQNTGQAQREQSQRGEGASEKNQERREGQRQEPQRSPSQREGLANERTQPKQEQKQGGQAQQKPEKSDQPERGQAQSQPDKAGDRDRAQQGQQNAKPDQQPSQQQADRAEGSVTLSAEQRTRIRTTVLASNHVPRVEQVNFTIRVGTVVPTSIRVVEVPSVLIEIYPQWRGYYYFVVRDDIIIVDRSHRIVSVVAVGSGGAAQHDGGRAGTHGVAVSMTTEEIRRIQLILRERGFTVEVDGVLGPQTRQAIIAFQRKEGIEATGEIDQRTSVALGVDRNQTGNQQAPGDRNQPDQQKPTAGQPGKSPTTTGQDDRENPSRAQQRPETTAPGRDNSPATNNTPPRQGNSPSDAGRSPGTR